MRPRHGHYMRTAKSRDHLRYVLINGGSFRCVLPRTARLFYCAIRRRSPRRKDAANANLRLARRSPGALNYAPSDGGLYS